METHDDTLPVDEVLETLVANHRAFLAFLERRVGNRAVAEDLLQEAFIRGMDKAGEIRQTESAIAWFYRVLRNAAIDYHRRQGTASRALSAFAAELQRLDEPDAATLDEICGCISRLAETLKPEYAQAIRRIEVDGVSVKDFASEVGITSGNAGVRVFRARDALRKQVVRSCGTCADHGCLDCSCARPANSQHAGLESR